MGGSSGTVKKSPEEKELGRIAVETRRDYEQRWAPTLDKYIADVRDNRQETKRARDGSTASTASAFGAAAPKVATAATRRGGNAAMALGNFAADQGTSGGLGLVDTMNATRDAKLRDTGNLVAIGRGEKAEATRGLAGVADIAAQQAQLDAQTAAADSAGFQDAAMTGAGLASYSYLQGQNPPAPKTATTTGGLSGADPISFTGGAPNITRGAYQNGLMYDPRIPTVGGV